MHSYGLLSKPALSVAAFEAMRSLGVWKPSDVKTANALLNATLSDPDKVFERYAGLTASAKAVRQALACSSRTFF